ncbi:hypothetical protein ABEB36_009343 [Hypothenemus hampei]|uniref:Uncharacterized protein n=1 Tax=Hypothenemus hampei TaxID=57062 RepID=A0ABD1EG25_HYPHA
MNTLSEGEKLSQDEVNEWALNKEESNEIIFSDEDLIVAAKESTNDGVQTDSEDDLQLPSVSNQEAINCLNKVLQWAVENQMSSSDQLVLQNLREKAVLLRLKKVRQHTITEYFK